jgi:hypothetical protein
VNCNVNYTFRFGRNAACRDGRCFGHPGMRAFGRFDCAVGKLSCRSHIYREKILIDVQLIRKGAYRA